MPGKLTDMVLPLARTDAVRTLGTKSRRYSAVAVTCAFRLWCRQTPMPKAPASKSNTTMPRIRRPTRDFADGAALCGSVSAGNCGVSSTIRRRGPLDLVHSSSSTNTPWAALPSFPLRSIANK